MVNCQEGISKVSKVQFLKELVKWVLAHCSSSRKIIDAYVVNETRNRIHQMYNVLDII